MILEDQWKSAISFKDGDFDDFVETYFSDPSKMCLLIGGAGFDLRATHIAEKLSTKLHDRLYAIFLKEQRRNSTEKLDCLANANSERLSEKVLNYYQNEIQIFAEDGNVVGGRSAINAIKASMSAIQGQLENITDIILDFSALSTGVSFPIAKLFYEDCLNNKNGVNFHVIAVSSPAVDGAIVGSPDAEVVLAHGFQHDAGLHGVEEKAKFWIPTLDSKHKQTLIKIHDHIAPDDTCPMVPFPAEDPKLGDKLSESFLIELQAWEVSPGDYLYVEEDDPLDVYRRIISIDARRQELFSAMGGATSLLSPMGTKTIAIGTLMAAIQKELPVYYVENIGYEFNDQEICENPEMKILHVWLNGQPYEV